MYDLDGLQAFYWVGRLGGVGAAARAMKLTQPAVSHRLRKLERQVGRKLYGMAGRRLVLSEDGKRLFGACLSAFDVLDAAESAFSGNKQAPLVDTVRIATLSEIAKAFVLPQVRLFRKIHPGVAFDIFYQYPYGVLSSIASHKADIGLTNEPHHLPQVEMARAFVETMVCVGRAPARKLSRQDLEKASWVTFGADDQIWIEFQALASKNGVTLPEVPVRVADIESILRLVADGAGFALAPAHSVSLRRFKELVAHSLPLPPIRKQVYMCRLKTIPMSRASAVMWDSLRARFKSLPQ